MSTIKVRERAKSVRKTFIVNRSFVITLPDTFVNDYQFFVIRCVKDLAVITPYEKDFDMVISGEIFNKLKDLKRMIEKERELLLQLKDLEAVYKQIPLDDIKKKIEELKKELDDLRLKQFLIKK